MRLFRRAFLWSLTSALAVACLSPTLPLPPPAPPDVEQIGQGEYRLEGAIPFAGTVLVLNQRTSLVYGKVVSDVYRLDVRAEPNDDMVLWYQSGDDVSDVTEFVIPADVAKGDAGAAPTGAPDAGPSLDGGGD
ncbi:MAG TPA: hypothetical protein VHE30_26625 [Polyangiaceae bacterium]|nr:hypothetical protein [Polyangiaceae bacterium]